MVWKKGRRRDSDDDTSNLKNILMSYKQKSLKLRITMFVETFASVMNFTDSERLGTRVLCLPHGQCASSLHAIRSLVRVRQHRTTAGPRTGLFWRLGCHVGMAWECQNGWDSNCGDGTDTAAEWAGGGLTAVSCVSADLCASRSSTMGRSEITVGVLKWYSSKPQHRETNVHLKLGTYSYYRKLWPQPFEAHASVINSAVCLVMNATNLSNNLRQQSWHVASQFYINYRDALC
jgi:hypothetical protein